LWLRLSFCCLRQSEDDKRGAHAPGFTDAGEQATEHSSSDRLLPAGRCGDVLPAVHGICDGGSTMSSTRLKIPQLVTGPDITREKVPFGFPSKNQITGG